MGHTITVVGLGPGSPEYLTLGAAKALQEGSQVVLRTEHHGIAAYLEEQGIAYTTLDLFYETESFERAYHRMSEHLFSLAEEGPLVVGVPGHPLIGEQLTFTLLKACGGRDLKILPGISRADAALTLLAGCTEAGLTVIPASELSEGIIDPRRACVLLDLHSGLLASETKLKLLRRYPEDLEVVLCRDAMGEMVSESLPLYALDQGRSFDHTVCLYLPQVHKTAISTFDFEHLTEIMALLRDENGCPWDRAQDHQSLKQYLIEEAYEVLEAIDLMDMDKLMEELGDLLLQVVFHARIAQERGEFDILDITTRICRKMIDRHTHIFGTDEADTPQAVIANWEAIKKAEKGLKSHTQVLRDIPANLPALMRGYKIQKKASLVGFDWDSVEEALLKVDEELAELRSAMHQDLAEAGAELGDLLFAVVNVARFLEVQPELALTGTIEKFIRRFEYIEQHARCPLEEMSLPEMDALWNQAKSALSRDVGV